MLRNKEDDVVKDGESVRVPLMMVDSHVRPPSPIMIGNPHRPHQAAPVATNDARTDALAARDARLTTAWKGA